jgi:hypothetical protein
MNMPFCYHAAAMRGDVTEITSFHSLRGSTFGMRHHGVRLAITRPGPSS